jgi:hypothetical protein
MTITRTPVRFLESATLSSIHVRLRRENGRLAGSPGPLAVRIPPESPAAAFYAIFRLFHLPLQNNFFANQNNR